MEKENKVNVSTGGSGFVGLLTIAFIVLKLCGVINWSWVWVLSPLWISALVGLAVAIIVIIIAIIIKVIARNY